MAPEPVTKARRVDKSLAEQLADEDIEIARLESELRQRRAGRIALLKEMNEDTKTVGFLENVKRDSLPDTTKLLMLMKWNTPTVYNGWEQVTKNPSYGRECFNLDPVIDHMPQMGSLVGFAVTLTICPGSRHVAETMGGGNRRLADHLASLPANLPKIMVVKDEDKPHIFGSMWGEVRATFCKSIGVVGCIVDGGVRDIDEMTGAGIHAMSRGVCVGHAFGCPPISFDTPVSVFGVTVRPGQLIHADKHGFLVVPEQDEQGLVEATEFMDELERKHTLVPGRAGSNKPAEAIVKEQFEAMGAFKKEVQQKYGTLVDRFGPCPNDYKQ